jgi:hypothetical protein
VSSILKSPFAASGTPASVVLRWTKVGSNEGIFMRHPLTVRVSANETLCEPTLSWDFLYGLIFSSLSISPLGDTASPFSLIKKQVWTASERHTSSLLQSMETYSQTVLLFTRREHRLGYFITRPPP